MQTSTASILAAAKRHLRYSRRNTQGLLLMIALTQWLPIGIIRLGGGAIPRILAYLVCMALFMLRCCLYCYVADMVTGAAEKRPFRCLAWPKLYVASLAMAWCYQRILVPLLVLLLDVAVSSNFVWLIVPVIQCCFSEFFLIFFLYDARLVKTILHSGKIRREDVGAGWVPMMANRIRLELRLAVPAVVPLLITGVLIVLIAAQVIPEHTLRLIVFLGQTLLWGVSLYVVPMQVICRFLHATLNYYTENVPNKDR